jgi:hypothetical protein
MISWEAEPFKSDREYLNNLYMLHRNI